MEICVFGRLLWPGGPQRIGFELGAALSRAGQTVDICFARASNEAQASFAGSGWRQVGGKQSIGILTPTFRLLTHHYNPERSKEATIDLDLLCRFEIERRSYDFVIYLDPFSASFAPLGRLLHRDQYLVYDHESAFKSSRKIPHLQERVALSRSTLILSSSDGNANLLRAMGFSDVKVLEPGIRRRFDTGGYEGRARQIAALTVWDAGRNPDAYLNIAACLKTSKITMAGNWPSSAFRENFSKRVKNAGLSDRLAVVGRLTEEEITSLFDQSLAFLRLGFGELGPGMGTLEAIGSGLPVAINGGLGVSKSLIPGRNYILVDETRPNQAAAALERIVEDPSEWERMHEANLRTASIETWDSRSAELLRILAKTAPA